MAPVNPQHLSHIVNIADLSARDLSPGAITWILFAIIVGVMALACAAAAMSGRG
jgi:hypothetical protein